METASSSRSRLDEVVKAWSDLYENETLEYNNQRRRKASLDEDNESEAFAQVFHALVHSSPSLSITLAQLEHDHALGVARKWQAMKQALRDLETSEGREIDPVTKAKLESDISHLKVNSAFLVTLYIKLLQS